MFCDTLSLVQLLLSVPRPLHEKVSDGVLNISDRCDISLAIFPGDISLDEMINSRTQPRCIVDGVDSFGEQELWPFNVKISISG